MVVARVTFDTSSVQRYRAGRTARPCLSTRRPFDQPGPRSQMRLVVFSASGRFDRTLSPPARRARRDCGSQGVYSVARPLRSLRQGEDDMNNIIYLIGLVVVVVAILGFFGLR